MKKTPRYEPLVLVTIVAPSKRLAKKIEDLVTGALEEQGVDGAVVGVSSHDCRGLSAKNPAGPALRKKP